MGQSPFSGFKRPKKKRASPEHDYQKAVIEWANANLDQYPELEYLYANANGGERHIMIAMQLREEGVKPGVPDLTLPVPRGGYHALYIEMKADKGSESPDQKRWLAFLKGHGYYVATSYGSDIAIQILEQYLAWPPTRVIAEHGKEQSQGV